MQKKYFVCCSFIDKKKIFSRNISSFRQLAGHLRKTEDFAARNIVLNQRLSASTVMYLIVKRENQRGEGIQTSEQSGLNIPVPLNLRLEEK
jgi:hypothetical protein